MRLEWAYPVPVHTISLSFRYFLNIFCRGTVPGYLYLCVYVDKILFFIFNLYGLPT
jgi:hypothetical protein